MIWFVKGVVTQGFGPSGLSVEPTMFGKKNASGAWAKCRPTSFTGAVKFADFHPGVDIACPVGTPILAPAKGKVVGKVWYRVLWNGRYVDGLLVEFRYEKDAVTQKIVRVDHLSKGLAVGTWVEQGQPFAWSGNTGASTGPHVHLEDRHGPAAAHWSESNNWFRYNPAQTF